MGEMEGVVVPVGDPSGEARGVVPVVGHQSALVGLRHQAEAAPGVVQVLQYAAQGVGDLDDALGVVLELLGQVRVAPHLDLADLPLAAVPIDVGLDAVVGRVVGVAGPHPPGRQGDLGELVRGGGRSGLVMRGHLRGAQRTVIDGQLVQVAAEGEAHRGGRAVSRRRGPASVDEAGADAGCAAERGGAQVGDGADLAAVQVHGLGGPVDGDHHVVPLVVAHRGGAGGGCAGVVGPVVELRPQTAVPSHVQCRKTAEQVLGRARWREAPTPPPGPPSACRVPR
jgi:hypothetical protein